MSMSITSLFNRTVVAGLLVSSIFATMSISGTPPETAPSGVGDVDQVQLYHPVDPDPETARRFRNLNSNDFFNIDEDTLHLIGLAFLATAGALVASLAKIHAMKSTGASSWHELHNEQQEEQHARKLKEQRRKINYKSLGGE